MRLSICIPTYNRAALLLQLLESIEANTQPDRVEIAISDNASTDETEQTVAEFAKRWPSLRYRRQPENLGPDRNYLTAVEISTGDFCWLMGSDDCIAPGAVEKVLAWIENSQADIYLGARVNCTYGMEFIDVERWLSIAESRYFDFTDDTQFFDYHRHARNLGALFSYLSSIVVRRKQWLSFQMRDHYIGSAYSHAWILLQVAETSGIQYSSEAIVLNRTGNDFFSKDGEARRILLDLEGYMTLANDLYPASSDRKTAFLLTVRRAHRPLQTLLALRSRLDTPQWLQTVNVLLGCRYSPVLIKSLTPLGRVLSTGLSIKKRFRTLRHRLIFH